MKVWLTVLMALAVTSCTTTEAQPPPTTPTTSGLALKLADEPVWTTENDAVTAFHARIDLALAVSDQHLTLIDIVTGKPRWDIERDTKLSGGDGAEWFPPLRGAPRLVMHKGELAVLAEYRTSTGNAEGLVLLSGDDGHVLWKAQAPHTSQLRVADDRVALVTTQSSSVAYDIRTGRQLWERPDMWPVAIAGDTVLASAGEEEPDHLSPGHGELKGGVVSGLDVTTGKPRWDLADRFDRAEVVTTGGDLVLVRGAAEGSGTSESAVFDTRDGRELTVFGGEDPSRCAIDDRIVACPDKGGLAFYDVVQDKTTHLDVPVDTVDAVRDGRIFIAVGDQASAVDTLGTPVAEDLPGHLVAAIPGHFFFRPTAIGSDRSQVSCYSLGV